MFRSQREHLAHPAFLGVYVAVPLIFAHLKDPRAFVYAPPIIAIVAFVAWMLSLRRMLAIGGTPTSKIAAGAQGYRGLVGGAAGHPRGGLGSRRFLLARVWLP